MITKKLIEEMEMVLARNMVNSPSIDSFINDVLGEIWEKGDIGEIKKRWSISKDPRVVWCRKQLKKFIQNEGPATEIVLKINEKSASYMPKPEDGPPQRNRYRAKKIPKEPWMLDAIKRGDELFVFDATNEFETEVYHVVDWIVSLNKEEYTKLPKIPYMEAVRQANQWVEKMGKKASAKEGAVTKMFDSNNGYHWVRLEDKQAFNREGKLMSNCISGDEGPYFKKYRGGTGEIWSLRDTANKPHISMELTFLKSSKNEILIDQLLGFANKQPKQIYKPQILKAFSFLTKGYKDTKGVLRILVGLDQETQDEYQILITKNNGVVPFSDIPEGSVVKSLTMSGGWDIPKNIIVEKYIDLGDWDGTYLPDGLQLTTKKFRHDDLCLPECLNSIGKNISMPYAILDFSDTLVDKLKTFPFIKCKEVINLREKDLGRMKIAKQMMDKIIVNRRSLDIIQKDWVIKFKKVFGKEYKVTKNKLRSPVAPISSIVYSWERADVIKGFAKKNVPTKIEKLGMEDMILWLVKVKKSAKAMEITFPKDRVDIKFRVRDVKKKYSVIKEKSMALTAEAAKAMAKELRAGEGVNKASKTDLYKAIEDQLGNKQFSLGKATKLLQNFNHSSKVKVLLDDLVTDGKLVDLGDNKYKKVEKESTEGFVTAFCKGKSLPLTKARLKVAVTAKVGKSATPNEILSAIREVLPQKTEANFQCPRCGSGMVDVIIASGHNAKYCPNDRVTLPKKIVQK